MPGTRYGNRTHIAGLKARRASRCTNRAYRGFKPAARLIRFWRLLREVHLRTLPPESIKPAKYSGRGTPVQASAVTTTRLLGCAPHKGLLPTRFLPSCLTSLLVSRSVLNNTSWYLQRHREKVRDKTPLPRVLLIQTRDHSTGEPG